MSTNQSTNQKPNKYLNREVGRIKNMLNMITYDAGHEKAVARHVGRALETLRHLTTLGVIVESTDYDEESTIRQHIYALVDGYKEHAYEVNDILDNVPYRQIDFSRLE